MFCDDSKPQSLPSGISQLCGEDRYVNMEMTRRYSVEKSVRQGAGKGLLEGLALKLN